MADIELKDCLVDVVIAAAANLQGTRVWSIADSVIAYN